MKFFFIFFLFSLSCVSPQKQIIQIDDTQILPNFTVNGKDYNHLIINRIPIYGNGMPDG